jgi:hypothetical protein
MLIRNTKHKGAVRPTKDTTLQASPEKIKKQQEDADRAMGSFWRTLRTKRKKQLLPPAHRRN